MTFLRLHFGVREPTFDSHKIVKELILFDLFALIYLLERLYVLCSDLLYHWVNLCHLRWASVGFLSP